MAVVYPSCCGLDLHKKVVVACLLTRGADGASTQEVRTFGTMTEDLLALADWLAATACTHVAMESTGVYWQPVWNLLEGRFTLLLVNPRHMKAVPGRKTDVKDCEWIAELLQHGLLTASFVPDRPQRELRELTRYRTALVQERSAEVNRLQKTLEGATSKLASVATDIMAASGRQMLAALVWRRFRAWAGAPRRCWWPRSAATCPASARRRSWRAGPACVRATMRAPGSGRVARRARAVPGCGRPWSRPPTAPVAPGT